MKLTSDDNQFVFDKINKIVIQFIDGYEVTLKHIKEHYFDFEKKENSRIEVANTFIDKELFNRFCIDDDITYLYIEGIGSNLADKNTVTGTFDIPCNMRISGIRLDGNLDTATEMSIRLEGRIN